ncbi:MAG TPA: hypothetical protein VIK10_11530 [Prolixibacteraceae bacterium]
MLTSDIYFFNPTCELAIANGSPYYTAPARLRQFESDLGYMPAWLGEEMDQVLIQGAVDQSFNERMRALGFRLPEIMNLGEALSDELWLSRPKGRFYPWGWSPAVYYLLRNMLPNCSEAFRKSAVAYWKPDHKGLYSRLTALELLETILKNHSRDWLPDQADLPVVCSSLESIHHEIDRFLGPSTGSGTECPSTSLRDRISLAPADLQSAGAMFPTTIPISLQQSQFPSSQFPKVVVKLPWSSSGRGLLLFPNPDSPKKNDEVLSGMLSQQGFVTVEPWHKKVTDLSYQFEILDGEVKYRGRTFLETDPKGRYVRNYLTEDIEIQQDVKVFMEEHQAEVVEMLTESLSQSKYTNLYEGWIGIDAIVYRNDKGVLKFHPMLEINGRFTMGAIALKIRNYLAEGSNGFLQIFYSKTGNFQAFCQKREEEKPLVMDDRKIVSGFLPLTPPSPDHHFGAYVEVTAPPPHYS